jgi:hypothetical protein
LGHDEGRIVKAERRKGINRRPARGAGLSLWQLVIQEGTCCGALSKTVGLSADFLIWTCQKHGKQDQDHQMCAHVHAEQLPDGKSAIHRFAASRKKHRPLVHFVFKTDPSLV